jgi:hypothetical protein
MTGLETATLRCDSCLVGARYHVRNTNVRHPLPFLLLVVSLIPATAMAQTKKPDDADGGGNDSVVASPAEKVQSLDYWTPQRMREAKPMPLPRLSREEMERLKNRR